MMKKRLFTVMLAAVMVFTLLPVAAIQTALAADDYAVEVKISSTTRYKTFKEAWEVTKSNNRSQKIPVYMKLLKDVNQSNHDEWPIVLRSGNRSTGVVVEIDLNGHTIDRGLKAPIRDG